VNVSVKRMKKVAIYTLTASSLSIIVFLCYVIFFVPWPGDTVSERTVESGTVGSYSIGNTKEEIMQKNYNFAFSPHPKPSACPKNWIYIKEITSTQRDCLLRANEWEAGYAESSICKEKEDYHVTLYFSKEKLNRIKIRCTLAI
jgi:hypothetical protein